MAAWVGFALLTCVWEACIITMMPAGDVGVDSYTEIKYMVITLMVSPLAVFLLGWWKKSKCKPIYDRWVIKHGINPDKWPDAPKPDKTSENRNKYKQLSKLQLLVVWVIIIVLGAWVAWVNYESGVFD